MARDIKKLGMCKAIIFIKNGQPGNIEGAVYTYHIHSLHVIRKMGCKCRLGHKTLSRGAENSSPSNL